MDRPELNRGWRADVIARDDRARETRDGMSNGTRVRCDGAIGETIITRLGRSQARRILLYRLATEITEEGNQLASVASSSP